MGQTKCSLSVLARNKSKNLPFVSSIPQSIRDEIKVVVKETKNTGKEQSLTFCELNSKIFVSDHAKGNNDSTYSLPCNPEHGKNVVRIGDLHTHPTQDKDTIGITPSTADFVSTAEDSVKEGVPQISCITSNEANMIHCYQPKKSVINNPIKTRGYKNSLLYPEYNLTDTSPFLRENIPNDFDHAWYSKETFKRIPNPSPKDIVHDSLLKSESGLRKEWLSDLDKGNFCSVIIQDRNLPNSKNNGVENECRKVLKTRSILGFEY